MSKLKLLVIGNGMAGVKCVEELLRLAPDLYEITIIGSEPHPNYNRVMLSKVLQGNCSIEDIVINDWSWYEKNGIRLLTGVTATRIDTAGKRVETSDGTAWPYDRLILATGSAAFIPPIPGAEKKGVSVFRSVEDCERLMEAAGKHRRAAVIGGGLLGLEAARGLLHLGMETTVVHNAPYIMNRQLDRIPAEMLQSELERQGMRFLLGKRTERITGFTRADGLRFTDGTSLDAGLVVLAVGIKPRIELAEGTRLAVNHAFIVNDYLQTNVPDIYAVGECAEHRGIAYGLVAPLYEQGKVLARVLSGMKTEPYRGSVPSAQLKISGIDVFSAGNIQQGDGETAYQSYDALRGTYKKVVMSGGKITGAILYGDISESSEWVAHVKRGTDAEALLLRKAENGAVAEAAERLSDSDIVCSCNGVCKSVIVDAVCNEGLKTADEVKERTKASGSCGGCRPVVESVIRLAVREGGSSSREKAMPVCRCSSLTPSEFKAAVLDISGTMPPLGCPVCRSAAGYYLSLQSSADGPGGPLAGEESLGEPQLAVRASLAAEAEQAARETADRLRAAVGRLSWPARTTAAVSASPRLQAGVPVSSVGIAGTPAGWEVYAGGFDELPVRQAELIGFALSAEQALEFAFACLEWYRDTAYWGEPVWKWLERTGLTAVRERLLDAGIRGELSLRLEGRLRKWENADSSGDGSGPEDGAALSERSVVHEA